MAIALVAMIGLNSCSKDCEHEFIEHDFTQDIVGTWTYLEEGQAEAMVINPDGSFEVTGVTNGGNGSLYEEKGTIKVVNNKVTLAYNSGDIFEGRLEFVAGKSLSIVINEEYDIRLTYNYCKEDLSDEIVGMWVCNDGPQDIENEIIIRSYDKNGKVTTTGVYIGGDDTNPILGSEANYKVVGDLVFKEFPKDISDKTGITHNAERLIYTPKATELGDIMSAFFYLPIGDNYVESTVSFLRIKQNLNLEGKTYDYISAYLSNAKGVDEDFTILGHTFNISNIDSNNFDMFFRSVLSCIELNDNTIEFRFINDGRESVFNDPITVEGNKVTVDMSAENPALRKVEMYMFQDANDSQLHIYMPTKSFINYFANLQIPTLKAEGKLDTNDAVAVEKVFADMAARVESINVSFVFKARK